MTSIEAILSNNKYNVDEQLKLLNKKYKKIETTRKIFEAFLEIFPTAARYQKIYIEKEMSLKQYNKVENLFKRCLFQCLDTDLQKTYITYIKIVKKGLKDELESINTAYEFVLKHVGMDINSCSIQSDHIKFLKTELKDIDPSEKIAAIRGVYHHAIVTPMSGVDQIWREYDSWENLNDKNLARGMLSSFHQRHQTAKLCCRQRKRFNRLILPGMLAKPLSGSIQARERDYLQLIYWCKMIEYEKSNPQKLTPLQLEERVVFTYKQALQYMRHFPEMWHSYAMYISEMHTVDDVKKIFYKAIEAIPNNNFIHLLFAEFLESNQRIEDAAEIYEQLIQSSSNPSLAFIHFMRFSRRCQSIESARKIFVLAQKNELCTWHVYVAAAQMELFQNKQRNIASKIFKLAFSKFPKNEKFILEYIDFLLNMNDSNNLRVFLERVLSDDNLIKSTKIQERYIDFEIQFGGDIKSIVSAEKRFSKALALPEVKERINIMKRLGFKDLIPCTDLHFETLKEIVNTKIPEVPIEITSKSSQHSDEYGKLLELQVKKYTSANESNYVLPDLSQLIEFKVGAKFIRQGKSIFTEDNHEWPIPELSETLQKFLNILPHPLTTQGIPVHPDYICQKISESPLISLDNGVVNNNSHLTHSAKFINDNLSKNMNLINEMSSSYLDKRKYDEVIETETSSNDNVDLYQSRRKKFF